MPKPDNSDLPGACEPDLPVESETAQLEICEPDEAEPESDTKGDDDFWTDFSSSKKGVALEPEPSWSRSRSRSLSLKRR